MSTTFSVRIPKQLKEKIDQNAADWNQEVRDFLTERVKQIELMKTLQEIEPRALKRKTTIDSTRLIREDRERQN
jgi:predicted transcriptional regulator